MQEGRDGRWLKVALWSVPTLLVCYGVAILTGVIAMCSSDSPIGVAALFVAVACIPVFAVALPVGLVRRRKQRTKSVIEELTVQNW